MKLPLGNDLYLNSDPLCYWITQRTVSKKGKERFDRVSGHYSTPDRALRSFSEQAVRSFDCETWPDLERAVENLAKTLQNATEAVKA